MKCILTVLLLAAALPLAADDPSKEPVKPPDFKGNAIMCKSDYALCIKAQCEEKVSENNQVRCKCAFIEDDWSLGPNSCQDRQNNLTSTYSNRFNVGSSILSCPQPISWAWCYGASCEKDPKDPSKAICRCPVMNSLAVILVSDGKCAEGNTVCSQAWSAASPQESKFANNYYYWYMTHVNKLKAEKPAEACVQQ